MSKTYTPGPWCIERTRRGRARYILPGTDPTAGWKTSPIAEILTYRSEEDESNAALIALAPETAAERDRLQDVNAELLAALDYAIGLLDVLATPDDIVVRPFLRSARAAIAKTKEEP